MLLNGSAENGGHDVAGADGFGRNRTADFIEADQELFARGAAQVESVAVAAQTVFHGVIQQRLQVDHGRSMGSDLPRRKVAQGR